MIITASFICADCKRQKRVVKALFQQLLLLHFVVAMNKVSGDLKSSSFDRLRPPAPPPPPPPPNSSLVLTTRPPRQAVSYLTCSKLCAICFVAGMVFGYSLRGRVKRWASKMLKKLG